MRQSWMPSPRPSSTGRRSRCRARTPSPTSRSSSASLRQPKDDAVVTEDPEATSETGTGRPDVSERDAEGAAGVETSAGDRRRRGRLAVIAVVAMAMLVVGAVGVTSLRNATAGPACPPAAEHPEWSVARRWDEALLDAIRRALP